LEEDMMGWEFAGCVGKGAAVREFEKKLLLKDEDADREREPDLLSKTKFDNLLGLRIMIQVITF
jgi:hypothetical protein